MYLRHDVSIALGIVLDTILDAQPSASTLSCFGEISMVP